VLPFAGSTSVSHIEWRSRRLARPQGHEAPSRRTSSRPRGPSSPAERTASRGLSSRRPRPSSRPPGRSPCTEPRSSPARPSPLPVRTPSASKRPNWVLRYIPADGRNGRLRRWRRRSDPRPRVKRPWSSRLRGGATKSPRISPGDLSTFRAVRRSKRPRAHGAPQGVCQRSSDRSRGVAERILRKDT